MNQRPRLILISAMTRSRVIGRDGALPWDIPEEYRHFLLTVRGKTVLMGRRSYEIFGPDLPDARRVVVSRSVDELPGAAVATDVSQAVELACSYGKTVFSSGGATIYEQTLPLADEMHLSFIKEEYAGDTYFPEWDASEWELSAEEDRGRYEFRIYRRRPGGTTHRKKMAEAVGAAG